MVEFRHLGTEECCDPVTIYDGATSSSKILLRAAGCSGTPDRVSSTGNQVLITFTSDASVQNVGFQLTWQQFVLDFVIHPCDPIVVICYLIWPCDIAVRIKYLISLSSSLSYNTVIKDIAGWMYNKYRTTPVC